MLLKVHDVGDSADNSDFCGVEGLNFLSVSVVKKEFHHTLMYNG